jgi:hypothetical protein
VQKTGNDLCPYAALHNQNERKSSSSSRHPVNSLKKADLSFVFPLRNISVRTIGCSILFLWDPY